MAEGMSGDDSRIPLANVIRALRSELGEAVRARKRARRSASR